jgi:hypothetical protein
MMKLFDLRANYDQHCSFLFKSGEDIHMWDGMFQGDPHGNVYPIPKGERDEDRIDGPLPDFTHFALRPLPTFSSRAREILDELLTPYGEFAAIELDEPMRYFAFNATTIVDVLDEQKSKIKRYTDGGVMRVEQHILQESVTTLPPIFKIPQTRRNTTYVNEAFVQRVQTSGLQGFRFELLFAR